MKFEKAFAEVKVGKSIRLPKWKPDVAVKVPDEKSANTAPYLYVESRFGRVPWMPTQIELFATDWEVR